MFYRGWPQNPTAVLSRAIARHCQNDLPLTVARFRISPAASRRQRRRSTTVLRSNCRRYDDVVELPDGLLLVVAPDCPVNAANHLVNRASRALDDAGISVAASSATFPAEVSSLDELLSESNPDTESHDVSGRQVCDSFDTNEIESGSDTNVARASEGSTSSLSTDANSALQHAAWLNGYLRHGATRQPRRRRAKRAFDLLVVVALSPIWLVTYVGVAAAIWLSSPGDPVVFRQRRTGRLGKEFRVLKFRTMVPNAEELKSDLAHLNEREWPDFKIANDPRITRIGRFLRKTSLDELPQLMNVIRGEMSLVGPRPHSLDPRTYDDWHSLRFEAAPGLTGLWQVSGRHLQSFNDRVRLDIAYLERSSLRLDMAIILRTIPAILRARGA